MRAINPHFSAADLENVFTLVDRDGSGAIDVAEFIQLMVFFKEAVRAPWGGGGMAERVREGRRRLRRKMI